MKITTFVELTPAQEKVLEDFQTVLVRTALSKPYVVATFTTFQRQEVKLTLDADGLITSCCWNDAPKGDPGPED